MAGKSRPHAGLPDYDLAIHVIEKVGSLGHKVNTEGFSGDGSVPTYSDLQHIPSETLEPLKPDTFQRLQSKEYNIPYIALHHIGRLLPFKGYIP